MNLKSTHQQRADRDKAQRFPEKKGQIRAFQNVMRGPDYRVTPYFQFDLARITDNIKILASAVRPDRIFYAVKCNSLPKVLRTIAGTGCGFEINNKNEWMVLHNLGLSGSPMINSSPISSPQDIRFLYGKGVRTFCCDSRAQVDNLAVNAPGVDAYVRLYDSNTGSRFKLNRLGTDFESAVDLIGYAGIKGINPVGVTFHVGSQCKNVKSWEQAIKSAARVFTIFPCLKVLNLGGGFPVAYEPSVPTISRLGKIIRESLDRYFIRRPEVWIEPGRYIVGDTAFSCASVIQVRETSPVARAVIDMSVFSGFMEILEIRDGFHYPVKGQENPSGDLVRYQLEGPSCAGTDILCRDIQLPRLKVDFYHPHLNSRIYFADTGAYTLDYIDWKQAFGFNGAPFPNIYYSGKGGNNGLAI